MKKLLSPWWAIITLIALTFLFLQKPNFTESVKLNYFDQLITAREPVQNNIYTANIDEAALEKYGQYPFPRNLYGDIIVNLYNKGAGLVVWNIMMPEEDRFEGDQQLSEVMMELPVILASRPSNKTKNEPVNPGAVIINDNYLDTLLPYSGIIANIPELENSSVGAGIVSTEPEIDGVNRRLPTVAVVDGILYPSLALETLRVVAGDPSFQIKLSPLGIDKMRIPQFGPITTDGEGRVWIDWAQRNKSFSVANIPDDLGGAIVIVDVTASGIANPVPTPMGAMFPGQVQASMLGTMFNQTNIERPYWANDIELIGLFVGGLLLIAVSRWTWVGLGLTVVLAGSVIPFSVYMFDTKLMLLDATAPTITLILVALHTYGIKFVREFLEKQAIKKQFAGYCSPEVVKILQENPTLVKDGIKKDISICFSDLRGFTNLGEKYGDDVKGLTEVMNGYMDAITQPVLDANGMIIKYIGDASMHIHGAPIDDEKHAESAVQTGLNMLEAVQKYNQYLDTKGIPEVGMGAGINTGFGFIGEMGSTSRHAYDVLGDAISTTARLESQCKNYGVLLIVGPETYQRTKEKFFYLKLDDLAVKGKSYGLDIYTVLRGKEGDTFSWSNHYMVDWAADKELHDHMHKLYQDKNFQMAIGVCNKLKGSFDGQMDSYYDMWIERCEFMKTQKLPKDWNGVFVATTK
tara:strand:+ start:507 stop:2576 length:2070 start_codon:yes stop_codon:yes gene_type:complete